MKLLPLLFVTALTLNSGLAARAAETDFYLGTYTHWYGSKGIYRYQFDEKTGVISGGELVAQVENPSYLALHPHGHFLYAASEGPKGQVVAYQIDPHGPLTPLNEQSSRGKDPCHISLDHEGRNLFVANYSSGTVAVFPLKKDGQLGTSTGFYQHLGSSVDPERQTAPYAHSIYTDPSGHIVYSCDLGTDRIYGYHFDAAKGTIHPDPTAMANVAPGSGPRHLAFHPNGEFVYLINEMLNTVTVFQRSGNGALHTLQTISTLPDGFKKKNTSAEIVVHPNGKFLYTSNRGDDSIAIFAIGHDGHLTAIGHTPSGGKTPRFFTLDPSGHWLLSANQDSNDIVVFKVDQKTGALHATGQKVKAGAPVSIVFATHK